MTTPALIRCAALALFFSALVLPRADAQTIPPVPPAQSKFDYQELARAPQKARNRPNPLENNPDAPGAGRKLFEKHCAECHGSDAAGTSKAPSLRAAEVRQATPGALFWLITNGVVRKGMPVWSKLPEPQRWQLVRFLKSLGPPEPAPQPVLN
ncbi:MAG: cytochrome c [Acidobacteriia bacterium]|nr:cytochrome c [Terriglobia bacterium]